MSQAGSGLDLIIPSLIGALLAGQLVAAPAAKARIAVSHEQVVLIVEDDVPLRTMWRTALRFEGFEVVEANDGFEALWLIDGSPPES